MILATPNPENAIGPGLVGDDLPLDRGLGDSFAKVKSMKLFWADFGGVDFFVAAFPKNSGCNALGLVGVAGVFSICGWTLEGKGMLGLVLFII